MPRTLVELKEFGRQVPGVQALWRSFRTAGFALRLGLVTDWLWSLRNFSYKERFGSAYGGWVVPGGRLHHGAVCYCVGCGEDISFDLEIIEQLGCSVEGFDPTPRSIAYVRNAIRDIGNYRFHEFGLWSTTGTLKFFAPRDARHVSHSLTNLQGTSQFIEVPVRRLSEAMADLGHERLSLLKLDVEGAAVEILETMIEDKIDVDILCVEFDELLAPTAVRIEAVRKMVSRLKSRGFKLYWAEGTNFTFVQFRKHGVKQP